MKGSLCLYCLLIFALNILFEIFMHHLATVRLCFIQKHSMNYQMMPNIPVSETIMQDNSNITMNMVSVNSFVISTHMKLNGYADHAKIGVYMHA